ncbi:T9SS type A sorting domain-containing protein [candidate division WOR-3 bacterium]|nr:T9SS type A sorting domain-containing protein [candidate division WOR-3 bacterium]
MKKIDNWLFVVYIKYMPIVIMFLVIIQAGWSYKTKGIVDSPPTIFDLDNDGKLEIVFGSWDRKAYILKHDGTLFISPINIGIAINSSPAIGDLNLDGMPEIVILARDGTLFVIEPDGASFSGFPIKLGNGYADFTSPALCDLNGGSSLEIILGAPDSCIYAIDLHGSILWSHNTQAKIFTSPAIGDLNRDGNLEVVAAAGSTLWVLDKDGNPLPNWEAGLFIGPPNLSSPALADIDPNFPGLEIILGSNIDSEFWDGSSWKPYTGCLLAFHWDGTEVLDGDNNPETYGVFAPMLAHTDCSPAVGNIDEDDELEIVIGTDELGDFDEQGKRVSGMVFAWNNDGTPLISSDFPGLFAKIHSAPYDSGFDDGFRIKSSPAIGDIDEFPDVEIVCATCSGDSGTQFLSKVWAWRANGGLVFGYPKEFGEPGKKVTIFSSPALGDLHGDFKTGIVIGGGETWTLYEWDTQGSAMNLEWPMFRIDSWHTGCYGFQQGVEEKEEYIKIPSLKVYPNPSSGWVNIEGQGTLKIYNLLGELILTKSIERKFTFKAASGIYFAKLFKAGVYPNTHRDARIETTKIIFLNHE